MERVTPGTSSKTVRTGRISKKVVDALSNPVVNPSNEKLLDEKRLKRRLKNRQAKESRKKNRR